MYRVTFPIEQLKQAIRRNRRVVRDSIADVLEVVGIQLLSEIQIDYDVKSRGSTGVAGGWRPLKPATIRQKNRRGRGRRTRSQRARAGSSAIGIDTGAQRNSATPGFRGTDGEGGNVFEIGAADVTVGFGRSYSKHFDNDRELIPDPLPQAWTDDLDQTVSEMLEEIISF